MRSRAAHFCLLVLFLPSYDCFATDLRIDFTEEKLENGLHVIYAPLRTAPVVHVRVHYHVGSRDDPPDRRGFAHMFEHMMFRGSAHVKNWQHMELVQKLGGSCTAATDYDQTVYENTVPSNQLEAALYLEADRMASFKVSQEIFELERKVVAEELRGYSDDVSVKIYDEFCRLAFTKHPYHWSRSGEITHLNAAKVSELQEFFNTYYIPNNAVLVVAGDLDLGEARALVGKYFGWMPSGGPVKRLAEAEPPQTEPRRGEISAPMQSPHVLMGWHAPRSDSDDRYALDLLEIILGRGRISRLNRVLRIPGYEQAIGVSAHHQLLEDGGYFVVSATVLPGKDPDEVEKDLAFAVERICEHGVANAELNRAKLEERIGRVYALATAREIAARLGNAAVVGGDAARVNSRMAKIENIQTADIQAAARKYLRPEATTTVHTRPQSGEKWIVATQPAMGVLARSAGATAQTRRVVFPQGYPQELPIAPPNLRLNFLKGTESSINGVKVVVMSDQRLPRVWWRLACRGGDHCDPVGKEGLADLTALFTHWVNADAQVEARGVSIDLKADDDVAYLSGNCLTEQIEEAMGNCRQILRGGKLEEPQLATLKANALSALEHSRRENEAHESLMMALYGSSPLGRFSTAKSIGSITLADLTLAQKHLFQLEGAIFSISGDVTVERGQELARKLLEGCEPGEAVKGDYTVPPASQKRRILVIDRPDAKQAIIRMGIRAYDLANEDNFAGTLASPIMTDALVRHVRAEKGLAYNP